MGIYLSFTKHPTTATATPIRAQTTEIRLESGCIVIPNNPKQTPTNANFIPFTQYHLFSTSFAEYIFCRSGAQSRGGAGLGKANVQPSRHVRFGIYYCGAEPSQTPKFPPRPHLLGSRRVGVRLLYRCRGEHCSPTTCDLRFPLRTTNRVRASS